MKFLIESKELIAGSSYFHQLFNCLFVEEWLSNLDYSAAEVAQEHIHLGLGLGTGSARTGPVIPEAL